MASATTGEFPQADSSEGKAPRFDPSQLRLSQDFTAMFKSSRVLTTIPVRRPDAQTYFRVRPEAVYRLETAVLEHHEDRETYLVDKSLWIDLQSEIVPKALYSAITRQGTLFIWAVRLPGPDGRLDNWNRSAHQAAEDATKSWIRMVSNRELGAYDVHLPEMSYPDPEWPDIAFEEILRIAFRNHFISDMDHPVIKMLRGRV
jgi:hypothetical protein